VLVGHPVVLSLLTVALALTRPTVAAAQAPGARIDAALGTSRYDPSLRFRTISTARFDIYFHQREEALAHRLAGFVEEAAAEIDGRLGAPHGRVHVILVDQTDQSNGWATVFPYNLIELAAVPPASQTTIGNTRDWLRLVFSHEYTHIVHLEKSRGWIGGLRHVFGRVPFLQPNVFLPQWQVEGLATFEESVSTGSGRVPAGDFRMILDQAAVHGRFASLDRADGGVIDWPSGNSPYVYGAYFHQFLAEHYGPASLARLAEATAGTLPFFGSRAYRPVFGRSLGSLWKDFAADTESKIASGAHLPVQATRLTHHGFTVTAPAFSPDGRLYYSLVNPHDFPAIMELRPGTEVPRRIASRYLGERMAVAGDRLVFGQLEVVRHTDLQSDLYAVPLAGGDTQRLTREARAADPDVAPDGHTIVCTVQQAGRRILALLEIPQPGAAGVPIPLLSEESTEFSTPRWSPDGRTIAAERRRLGGASEIVLLDVATHTVRTLVASEQGRNFGPTWLADGGTILFSSDRGGAPFAIFGADVRTGGVRALVGTGPGAQFPALSPDGRRLVFVGYTADGYDLFSISFDAPQWADSPAATTVPMATPLDPLGSGPAGAPADAPYRPWSTLAPRYWVPVLASDHDDVLVGASTSGFDALGRHAYVVTGTWAVQRNVPNWQADYSYSRWWPELFAGASESTDDWRSGEVRSREVTAGVLLPVRRVRWTTAALAAFQVSHDEFECPACEPAAADTATLTATQFGWSVSSAKAFGYSISAEQGAAAAVTAELRRSGEAGSAAAGAATVDMRGYARALPRHGVLALRAAGATTWGDQSTRRVFDAGGSGAQTLGFDFGSHAINLLRGFDSSSLYGFHAAVVNVDYRFPLGWPQRGYGTLPAMVRNLHGAVFFDAGNAWDTSDDAGHVRRSIGIELSSDTVVAAVFPLTITGGAAWRHDPSGRDEGWAAFARVGRAF
jgi:hypothetical protein